MNMNGKVALVTGGNAGIGKAVSLAFAKAGAKVAIAARREAEAQATVQEIEAAGGAAIFVRADVNSEDSVRAMVDTTLDHFGRLDYACNNAGIVGATWTPTADLATADWNRVIATNLTGVFWSMKYEIPAMLKSGGGAIVNMSSIAGLVGSVLSGVYAASKHGVIGLTKSAALEYAKLGIRVNAVCPAVINTDMAADAFPAEIVDQIRAAHALGRFGNPPEVADVVVFLCSDHASFMTGAAIPIDGGLTAR